MAPGVHKVYDSTGTAYRRLLESNAMSSQQRWTLDTMYHGLNPV